MPWIFNWISNYHFICERHIFKRFFSIEFPIIFHHILQLIFFEFYHSIKISFFNDIRLSIFLNWISSYFSSNVAIDFWLNFIIDSSTFLKEKPGRFGHFLLRKMNESFNVFLIKMTDFFHKIEILKKRKKFEVSKIS